MRYFNGFSLEKEQILFSKYLTPTAYTVAGFSYGAQQAFEYAYTSTQRIDRLILFSPAFFQTKKSSFIRAQLRYFHTDNEAYVKQFLHNVSYPSSQNLEGYVKVGTPQALEALLHYVWEAKKIEALQKRGVTIEVFLGDKDNIVHYKESFDFFNAHTTIYTIKNVGHLLKG